jgi:NhaA family Na+:H+ antiporter
MPRSRRGRAVGRGQTFVSERVLTPVQEFISKEASSGIVLLAAAVIALAWANSPLDGEYFDFWASTVTVNTPLFRISDALQHWVNNGLMAVFFFVVALEIKREVLHGELAGARLAALPVAAALGGMVAPALLFTAVNAGGAGAHGWGIPMATDIAFALGVLAILSDRVPSSLRLFLLALAIVDDLGAILVIAVFYTSDLDARSLGLAAVVVALIVLMRQMGVRNFAPYVVASVCLWIAVHESGVHSTIAGVALGLLTPSRNAGGATTLWQRAQAMLARLRWVRKRDEDMQPKEVEASAQGREAPLERLERILHPWSSYVVLPVFALANAGIYVGGGTISDAASSSTTLGVIFGLLAGKFAGVLGATWLATALGMGKLPNGVHWRHVAGAALLAGIGFTVSLFITGLAYDNPQLISDAKIGILGASVLAGLLGFTFLRLISSGERRQAEAAPA